jgi:hypothetical protein
VFYNACKAAENTESGNTIDRDFVELKQCLIGDAFTAWDVLETFAAFSKALTIG